MHLGFPNQDTDAVTVHPCRPEEEADSQMLADFARDRDHAVTFEDVLEKMGVAGKYQYVQCALCLSCVQLITFMSLGFVFIGYTPPHECQRVNETELLTSYGLFNDSSSRVSYGQCDIVVTSNQSGRLSEVVTLSCPLGRYFPQGKHMSLVSEWDLACERKGQAELAQLMYAIGNMIGGFVAPSIADRFGRRPVLWVAIILNMLLEFVLSFAPNFYFVCTILFLDGISYVGIVSVYLVLGMEILVPRHRQIFGVVACQYWVFCVLVVGLVGYLLEDVGWRYFQAVGALTGCLSLGMPFFLCESPRWLAINGRSKEALAILKKASKDNGTNFAEVKNTFVYYMNSISPSEQIQGPKGEHDSSNEEAYKNTTLSNGIAITRKVQRYTLLSMLMKKDTLILLLVIWYLWSTCITTYYGIYMSSSNLAGNRFLNFALMALVEIPANFLVLVMLNRMGRLQVLRIFLGFATATLLSSMLLAQFDDSSSISGIINVSLFILGKLAITSAFNAVYICTPEIFPTVLRSSGNGSCKSVPKIGATLAPYSRPLYTVARWAPGLIFSAMSFLAVILTFLLPETKDKILPTQLSDIGEHKKQKETYYNKAY